MHIIKSVGVLSVAKIMGAMYCALGLLFMPIFLVMALAGMMAGNRQGAIGAAGGVAIAVLFPIVYGVLGFIAGAIAALLYNLFAKVVGGIELQLQAPAGASGMVLPPSVS